MKEQRFNPICVCGNQDLLKVHEYTEPPSVEVHFEKIQYDQYFRELYRCRYCGHFVSHLCHELNYEKDYVDANYKDIDGIYKVFEKIIKLPPENSDNIRRVAKVHEFASERFNTLSSISLLDIGSGLGVFPYAIKQKGWECTALDPDERNIRHIQEHVKVRTICSDFFTANDIGMYDIITFNRVLEHVNDPIEMLRKSGNHLKSSGFVYLELPDGEKAFSDDPNREEFTIDHLNIFSPASLAVLVSKTGFLLKKIERSIDPSGKYTLRAFIIK